MHREYFPVFVDKKWLFLEDNTVTHNLFLHGDKYYVLCMDPSIVCPPMSRVPFCQCQLTAVWSISTMPPHQTIRHPAMFPLTSKEIIKDDGQTDKKEKTKKWNNFTVCFCEKRQRNVSLNDWIWFAVALSEFAEALSENSWTMTCVLRRNLWRYNCGRPKEVFG